MRVRRAPGGDRGRHGRTLRASAVGVLVMSAACTVAPHGAVQAARVAPSLAFVARPGHPVTVAGKNWGRRVVVTARIGDATGGISLGAQSGGTFTVAIDYSVPCGGITVEARDYRGDDATIRRPGPLCPNRIGEPPPVVSVVQGSHRTPRVRVLTHPSTPRKVTLHLGDVLQITEPGGPNPAFLPLADAPHLALLGHAVQESAACTQAPCVQQGDQFWQWIAVQRGRATVTLSPACRQSDPPCERPEALIAITIVS